ncbi:MAG: hypothetical protein ABFS37_07090 [Acidobacteriota bacterium]
MQKPDRHDADVDVRAPTGSPNKLLFCLFGDSRVFASASAVSRGSEENTKTIEPRRERKEDIEEKPFALSSRSLRLGGRFLQLGGSKNTAV